MRKLKLWIKHEDGSEYIEYKKPSIVPEDVQLNCLRESARQAGNRVIESNWSYVNA